MLIEQVEHQMTYGYFREQGEAYAAKLRELRRVYYYVTGKNTVMTTEEAAYYAAITSGG